MSGIAAEDGPLATVGSGISPRRAINLVHSCGVSAELAALAARAPLAPAGPNDTTMWSLAVGFTNALLAPGKIGRAHV